MDNTEQQIINLATQDLSSIENSNPEINNIPIADSSQIPAFTQDTMLQIKQALRNEIINDPKSRGYAGKTNAEIANLLNGSYQIQTGTQKIQQLDENGLPLIDPITNKPIFNEVAVITTQTPRIAEILLGIPYAPNIVTETDIQTALA